jgi:hypothetical protein
MSSPIEMPFALAAAPSSATRSARYLGHYQMHKRQTTSYL